LKINRKGITIVSVGVFSALMISLASGLFADVQLDISDADLDEIEDVFDNCPKIQNNDQDDFDKDSLGNPCDEDDDNDGIMDSIDFFDTDPLEWADFDFDGIGSIKDEDDDNDGIIDAEDTDPTLPSEDLARKYLQEIQDCAETDDGPPRLLCYSQFFGRVAENEENNSDALELSIALSKMGTIDDCHFVSHEIGHVAFNKNPNVIPNLVGMDGTMCRGGYFHGVLASYFHDIEEAGEPFPSTYNIICDDLIGSSNYQDCIHGLGHGLVHYFGEDLSSSLELCHDMSFYQNILCVKGVMMQHTDNILTRQGISKDVISNLCDGTELESLDFVECSMSVGTTLAFFTDHNFDEGAKSCELIEHEQGQNYCLEGLRLEIEDSEKYEIKPLTKDVREKFQPQSIEGGSKTIDIRSPAVISDFEFIPQAGIISFSIDRPQYVILYIPSEFVTSKMVVTVNGQIPNELDAKNNIFGEKIAMIRFVPNNAGLVMITPLT